MAKIVRLLSGKRANRIKVINLIYDFEVIVNYHSSVRFSENRSEIALKNGGLKLDSFAFLNRMARAPTRARHAPEAVVTQTCFSPPFSSSTNAQAGLNSPKSVSDIGSIAGFL
jgi:hypothetical protein